MVIAGMPLPEAIFYLCLAIAGGILAHFAMLGQE
jgi:hypothetical protein